jgi:hypothetical protein
VVVWGTAILCADLHDTLVLPRRLDEFATLPNIVAERFLNVDILSRLTGEDGSRRMPMIRRGHYHGIDALIGKNLLHSPGQQRLPTALLCCHVVGNPDEAILVDVAHLRALDITAPGHARGDLRAPPAAPNQRHLYPVVGPPHLAKRRETQRGRGQATFQEHSAFDGIHMTESLASQPLNHTTLLIIHLGQVK